MKTVIVIMSISFGILMLPYDSFSQIITTIAGGATGHGGYWGDGGPATNAQLETAAAISVDDSGNVYIGDKSRVLKINRLTGIITTISGTGSLGYNGDGIPANTAMLNWASSLDFDHLGNLYIGDGENYRMRKVDIITGIISTFVGNGSLGSSGDGGLATLAQITGGDFTWDSFGNFYFSCKRKIRKVSISGIVTTVAGTGLPGITGEGVLATSTNISFSNGLSVDRLGNVYFSDSTGSVRKITISSGIINRVAGTGDNIRTPYSGDGIPATSCHISPLGIQVDFNGYIYIADGVNNRVEIVDTFGIIRTIAGNGINGFSGDGGLATNAKIWVPQYVKLDACGNVYIADFGNKRVRKVTMPPTLTIPTISLSVAEAGTVMPVGSTVTVNATVANAGSSYMIRWQNRGVEFATTTVPVVTYTKMPGVDTITARVVSTASYGCYDSTTSAPQYVSDSSTSVRGVGVMGGVYVYPNPAKKQVTIMAAERMRSVAISNMQGQELLRYAPDATSYTVTIDMLPPGVYMVRVNDVWVGKVVKE